MEPLKPNTVALKGQILIEASAGTGKTYTIAHLYLRLLLEKGFSVDQILVVTFTEAATEELRERLRLRVRQALDVFKDHTTDDKLLHSLTHFGIAPDTAIILLQDALTRMDEAAIYTIHSFCHRMLQEHAFESGVPFSMELLESEHLLRRQIMEDFWRQKFYPLPEEELVWITRQWPSPEALLNKLGQHLNREGVVCLPKVTPEELERLKQEFAHHFKQLQNSWQQSGSAITTLLVNAAASEVFKKNFKKYQPQTLRATAKLLDDFFITPNPSYDLPENFELYTSTKISKAVLKAKQSMGPSHPFFELAERFMETLQQIIQIWSCVILQSARAFLEEELHTRKQRRNQFSFDDLLTQMDQALQPKGKNNFARTISQKFPAILVDEFQDTDPLQYRIFSTIHPKENDGTQDHCLFLIGDPKQAIYAFRGADIFTYLQAKKHTCPENQWTLRVNYRSTQAMVNAVNWLFDRDNAFILDTKNLDFVPGESAQNTGIDLLRVDDTDLEPLQCLVLLPTTAKQKINKQEASENAAGFSAHEIAGLLNAGAENKASFNGKPLCAGDIAVLVRTHKQADTMRRALQALGICSVYLSQDSVFATEQAQQIAALLSALANPTSSGLVQAALATELFGYTAAQLDQLQHNENQWEEIMAAMSNSLHICRQKGFFTLFQQLLANTNMVGRLVNSIDGERKLTNFLQLADLLQEAGHNTHNPEQLCRWLFEQMQDTDTPTDRKQLRLESDEHLIKIVTIHKSKGMEYPVVFLPFLWSARPCKKNEPLAFHPRHSPDKLHLDLGTGDPDNFKQADAERLAEEMRLLYVAVTRAKYCCYFCWGQINQMEQSALYTLLDKPAKNHKEVLSDNSIFSPSPLPGILAVQTQQYGAENRPIFQEQPEQNLEPAHFQASLDTDWQISSYSRLLSNQGHTQERPDYDQLIAQNDQTASPDAFGFPRGAAAGTCLHTIFEQIDFANPADHEQIISTQLQHAGYEDSWIKVVYAWIQDILRTELHKGFTLNSLPAADRVNEMSFYFPLNSVDLHSFNQVLNSFSHASLPQEQGKLKGLMVGFIDLVFRFKGKYYLADYKSNHLGSTAADYLPQQLQNAMLEHRYDLQYLIYSLALHRFLKQRIADYSYDDHFGGIFYLFLRGIHPAHEPGTGIFTARPVQELISRLDQCCANMS